MSVPNAPTNLVGTQPPGNYPASHTGTLTWDDNTGGTAQHKVYREVQFAGGHEADHVIATIAAGTVTFVDDPLIPQHIYIYHVSAFNDDGESEKSNECRLSGKFSDPG